MWERKESCSSPGSMEILTDGEDYGKDKFYKEYQKLHFEYVKFEMLIKYSSGNVR